MILIDKNIPLPDLQINYPFDKMEVSDSFQVGKELLNNLRNRASFYSKNNGTSFMIRTYNDGIRCWRTK